MDYELESRFNKKYSIVTRRMMRILSYDARASITDISRELGLSRSAVTSRLRRMEKEFGIRYTAEFDEEKLGVANSHLVFVKFGKKPSTATLSRMLKGSGLIRFASTLEGSYDLMICATAPSRSSYAIWDRDMRRTILLPYRARWDTSEMDMQRFGFFPIRNEMLDGTRLPAAERDILKALNQNSRATFEELSKITGLSYKNTIYHFKKMMGAGYVRRFTIAISLPKWASVMCLFSKYIPMENYREPREITRSFLTSDDQDPLISRCLMNASLIGSYDFFVMGAFDDFKTGRRHFVTRYRRLFRKFNTIKVDYGQVKEVIVGELPLRNLDTRREYLKYPIG